MLESFHIKFLKRLLKVNKYTANCMVYGELGRFKLSRKIECRMISFWCRLLNGNQNKLSFLMYRLLRSHFERGDYKSRWLSKLKEIMDSSGFSYLWYCDGPVSQEYIKVALEQRLSVMQEQDWLAEVDRNSLCRNFRIFKHTIQLEGYLKNLDEPLRCYLTKFRCGASGIPVVTGRFPKTEYQNRVCPLCNNEQIGDEFHYLLECNHFSVFRRRYLPAFARARPNVYKMDSLMNTSNIGTQRNLARLCKEIILTFKRHST